MSLSIKNLKKSFHQGQTEIQVLKNLNLELQNSEIIAILGESGSGKSTFLSLLAGLENSDSGEISIGGVSFGSLSENELTKFRAQNISIVFQQYHLLNHLTALENVLLPTEILNLPNPDQIKSKAENLLSKLGLSHRLSHFPNQLSGGEKQRVAIARALIVEPKILLADEPSGNLDPKTGDSVLDSFFEIIKEHKITTLFVTHSEALAKRCQKILKLQDGQLHNVTAEIKK